MENVKLPPARWRFGAFEVDPASGELRKQGRKVRLAEQSIQVLIALLERPGEVVTRQQLHQRLWPRDTFVDFDANLNSAMSLLREALGDSARSPRFIETLPRRGYRFLASVAAERAVVPEAPRPRATSAPPAGMGRRLVVTAAVLAVLMLAGLSYRYMGAPSRAIDALAVLPLVYAGPRGDGDQEHLADGLTSALITELARRGVPNVISETSVMRYKGAGKPLPTIARELGAGLLVEGSVLREGNTVRVNAQLIDARSDRHLWAQSYQQELHSILTLQDEIARAIVRELRSTLDPSAVAREHAASRRVNPQAHEAYLRGRYALREEVESRRSKAREFFEEAIRIDSAFAPAYAGLADYYGYTDAVPPGEALSKARGYARRALELDDTLAGAHLTLAQASLWGDWDWTAAEREFKRSLELDPSDARTLQWYALFLDLIGRPRAALAQLQRARHLDPVSPGTHTSLSHHFFLGRRYEEALEEAGKARELSPHHPMVFEALANIYVHTGSYQQAIDASEQGIALWGRDPALLGPLAVAHARAGDRARARALLDELHEIAGRRHVPPSWFALVHMNMGEVDRAMEWLERAFEARDVYLVHLRASPLFDLARGHARFPELLERMTFPAPEAR